MRVTAKQSLLSISAYTVFGLHRKQSFFVQERGTCRFYRAFFMCGIIGYIGKENAVLKLTEGLSVLEYRGYDSVGIAAERDGAVEIVKCKGRIDELQKKREMRDFYSNYGIGHTRWATHGAPSDLNAHPHSSGNVVLVHNGIIENYKELQAELDAAAGKCFVSETDTEIAAALLDVCYEKNGEPLSAIAECVKRIRGSYALAVLFRSHPGQIYAVRRGSPLILAAGEDGNYLASDMTAFLPFTKKYYCLEEGDVACLTRNGVTVYGAGGKVFAPSWNTTELNSESAKKGGYPHFMLKEIFEQPHVIPRAVLPRVKNGLPDLSEAGIAGALLKEVRAIQLVACGSAMHAGLLGAGFFESYARIPATVHIASEYRYHPPIAHEGTLVVLISQSGETADTLAALRYAKAEGLTTLAIVNAFESTIAREADHRIYTCAGPEIAVATTKGYSTQVVVLLMLALRMALERKTLEESAVKKTVAELSFEAPRAMERFLKEKHGLIRDLAKRLARAERVFYIGRGADHLLSVEAALKLKEISYIHAEAYAAGELKHGTISLIEKGTPVIAVVTEQALFEKTESNVREAVCRGALAILICDGEEADRCPWADGVIPLPHGGAATTLLCAIAAVQLLAYESARERGCDIDRPRNLAKSVTVE